MIGKRLHQAEPIPETAREALEAALQSGDLFRYHSEDAPVTLLEQDFAQMMGAKFALAVSSCSQALFLSMKALGLGKGDKVIIPAFTFAAVPSAVVHADCTPVLVEVGENYRMNMDDFRAKMAPDIKAVLVSHMRGHTSDMDVLKQECDRMGIPLIEDAAHSMATTWNGTQIGRIGVVGCFSFQSYKLVNGGEGGILVTDDEDLIAQAVIMSGAYESNWQKHKMETDAFARYQNTLPLYNCRMNNLSAIIIRPQLGEVKRRAVDGLKNHDYVADRLNASPYLSVPPALEPEHRAPDSIQFNLVDFSDAEAEALIAASAEAGLKISIFGLHRGNARVFWNWKFLDETPKLPQTEAMLRRACDIRLPAALTQDELDQVVDVILGSVASVKQAVAAQ